MIKKLQPPKKTPGYDLPGNTYKNINSDWVVKVLAVQVHKDKSLPLLQQYRDMPHVLCEMIEGHCSFAENIGWPLPLFREHFKKV